MAVCKAAHRRLIISPHQSYKGVSGGQHKRYHSCRTRQPEATRNMDNGNTKGERVPRAMIWRDRIAQRLFNFKSSYNASIQWLLKAACFTQEP